MGVSTPHTYIRLLQAVCRDRRDRLARVVPGRCEGNEFQRRYHSARRAAVGLIGITDVERAVQGDAVPRQAVWKRVIKRNRRLSLQVHIRGVGGGYQADHPERQYERLLHLVSPIEIIANRRQNHRFTMYANGYNVMRGLPHNDAETRRYPQRDQILFLWIRFFAALRFRGARLLRAWTKSIQSGWGELYRLHSRNRQDGSPTSPDRYAVILAQETDRWRIIKDSRTHVRLCRAF